MRVINAGAENWRRVLWSGGSPFELHHPHNHHNDRVWAVSSSEVPAVSTVKHPTKVHVWGMMSHRAMTQLHVVTQKTVINGDYVLPHEHPRPGLFRHDTAQDGGLLQRLLTADNRQVAFMQHGAPPHTASRRSSGVGRTSPAILAVWPGNSPELNPFENIWAILQDNVNKMPPATTTDDQITQLNRAWRSIQPRVLDNQETGMPQLMRDCIANKGDRTGK